MIPVHCHSNLDLNNEKWPTQLPALPCKGQRIQSAKTHNNDIVVELEVVQITWRYNNLTEQWWVDVELHLPKHRWRNISEFEEWYSKINFS